MHFVGRDMEIKKIIGELDKGHNIILTGRFGIGRSSLIRYISDMHQNNFRFIFTDFSQTPGKISKCILAELFPTENHPKQYRRYKSSRFLIANLKTKDGRLYIIVLDNIAKLSAQKLSFIRHLAWEKRFQFIAIAETFLPSEQLIHLRAELMPAVMIKLPRLNAPKVREWLGYASEKYKLPWSKGYIEFLVKVLNGYPLGIRETIERAIERKRVHIQP